MEITIEGFKINRLLNKIHAKHIRLGNISFISETKLRCNINYENLDAVKTLAGTLYRIDVINNMGFEYRIKGILKKPFEIGLVALALALVIGQSFFVKTIEIDGYRGIPESDIRHCLSESGIEEGSFIPKINWKEAERHIYDVFPEVSWLKLMYDGRKIFLNISEGDVLDSHSENATYEDENKKYYCNIIAREAGYIESISVYRGMALVEEGDYVEKGQILILGCVPIKEKYHEDAQVDTEYLVKAAGDIRAIMPYRVNFEQGLYDENNQVKSKKQIEAKAEQQIRNWCIENLPENAEILNKDLNFCYKENIIEIGVTLEIRGQIGKEQEIIIGQKNSDSSRH